MQIVDHPRKPDKATARKAPKARSKASFGIVWHRLATGCGKT
ncbi:hypothetical protein [Nitrosospira sp. Nsp13]|nr:hypothetical protein [Nitrosospira sp. Nsp13]